MKPARVRLSAASEAACRAALLDAPAEALVADRLISSGSSLRKRLLKTGTACLSEGFTVDAVAAALRCLIERAEEPTEAAAMDWLCLSPDFPLPAKYAVVRQACATGDVSVLARADPGATAAAARIVEEQPPVDRAEPVDDGACKESEEEEDLRKWILNHVERASSSDDEEDWEAKASSSALNGALGPASSRQDIAEDYERRRRDALTAPAELGLELRRARSAAKSAKQAKDAAAQKAASEVIRQLNDIVLRRGLTEEQCLAAAPDTNEPSVPQLLEGAPDDAGFALFDEDPADGSMVAKGAARGRKPAPAAPPVKKSTGKLTRPVAAVALQMPKATLQQLAQRKGWPAPRFERRSRGDGEGYTYAALVETVTGRRRDVRTFEQPGGARDSVEGAQNAAACAALAHLLPGEPLQHLLPPPYDELWRVVAEDVANAERVASDAELLDAMLDELVASKRGGHAGRHGGTQQERPDGGSRAAGGQRAWQQAPSVEQAARAQAALRASLEAREADPACATLRASRAALPIAAVRGAVDAALTTGDAIVVCGETGCGKSTQVPQYLLDDATLRGDGAACSVLVTQPRRVAAMSLADRVAFERGEAGPGVAGAVTGYAVRGDSARSPATRILFLTTGVLLRRLHGDPALAGVSHVVLDEVHERSLDADLLLACLRDVQPRRDAACLPTLKVVLMSATLDAALFSHYMGGCPVITAEGRAFPVETMHLEDVYHLLDYLLPPDSLAALRGARRKGAAATRGDGKAARLLRDGWGDDEAGSGPLNPDYDADAYAGLSERARRSLARVNEAVIDFDLIEELLAHIHKSCGPGAVLVFLPGIREVGALHSRLASSRLFSGQDVSLLPLHSALSGAEQRRVFQPAKRGTRKLVLATNIAETSVTLDDCAFVVDTGRQRAQQFNSRRGLRSLEEEWVSAANAKQRCGRAGRVRAGICYALYTRRTAAGLRPSQSPEILRMPLTEAALHVARMGLAVEELFDRAPTPPEAGAVARALDALRSAGAMRADETLTPLGVLLSSLPVDVQAGKALLLGSLCGCARLSLTLCAALCSAKPPFSQADDRDASDRVRSAMAAPGGGGLAAGAMSDALLAVDAYETWRGEIASGGQRAGAAYCRRSCLDPGVLVSMHDTRSQLASLLQSHGWFDGNAVEADNLSSAWNAASSAVMLRDAVLCGALSPQVAVGGEEEGRDVWVAPALGGSSVVVHPASVLHGVRNLHRFAPFLLYQEANKTSQVFLRDCSAVSPAGLALFAGQALAVQHAHGTAQAGDVRLAVDAQAGSLLRSLRRVLDAALSHAYSSAAPQPLNRALLQAVAAVLRDNMLHQPMTG